MKRPYHKNTWVIAGSSPRACEVPESVFTDNTVLALNRSYYYKVVRDNTDYWLIWDDHIAPPLKKDMGDMVNESPGKIKFIRLTSKTVKLNIPDNVWFYRGREFHDWENKGVEPNIDLDFNDLILTCCRLSVTTAAELACFLGATEILLVGVDLVGLTEHGGNLRGSASAVSDFLRKLPIPVYKTFGLSPLNLPCKDLKNG